VQALEGSAGFAVVDPRTGQLAVALSNPPRLLLRPLDGATGQREVPLPGPASDLVLAAEGGPLLVPVATTGSLLQVPLDGGPPSRIDVGGRPQGAISVGGRVVVASGDRVVLLGAGRLLGADRTQQSTVTGFTDAVRLAPAGSKVAVLDRAQSTVSLVDPATGRAGPALRAGNGVVSMVADRFGRLVLADVRDGELLVFAGDPLLLRQRYPLPGAPYGLVYDARRDLAWVTLTARNEVVGLRMGGGEPEIVHRFATVKQPDAVAVDPVSGRVVVVSASGAGLQVIDPERVVH
jgi:DNA-binding beta-propeller fold protein YncE